MDTWWNSHRTVVIAVAAGLPLIWCAVAAGIGDGLAPATSALVLVLLVVAAAATGDRVAGLVAALSGAAWFDFFLTAPVRTFAIDDPDDLEVAVLLVLVGAAVTEIALWGRRQQASSSARAGYLDGVLSTTQVVAGRLPTTDLVEQVTHSLENLLGADACRFVDGVGGWSGRPVVQPDGSLTVNGTDVDVDRHGLPTMDEIVLPARHHGVEVGHFLVTASTGVARPTREARQVAVLLANVVGAELAASPPER